MCKIPFPTLYKSFMGRGNYKAEKTIREFNEKRNAVAMCLLETRDMFLKEVQKELEELLHVNRMEYKYRLRGLIERIRMIRTTGDDNRIMFKHRIEHRLREFLEELSRRFPMLTETEKAVCVLILEGNSSREIADLLNRAKKTIDVHRHRIRRKLEIPAEKKLKEYLKDQSWDEK